MSLLLFVLAIAFLIVIWWPNKADLLVTLTCLFFVAFMIRFLIETIIAYLWSKWGLERILREDGFLIIRRELFGKTFARRYEIGRIQNLHLTPKDEQLKYSVVDYKKASRIAFEYGFKKVHFCSGVPDERAEQIIQDISQLTGLPVSRFAG